MLVKPWALEVLACLACGTPLVATPESSALGCQSCGARHPIVRGVPRFVTDDAYADAFSFEWLRHARTQLDDAVSQESEQAFAEKTGLRPEDVRGTVVLDVGCGMGRFSDVVSRWGGRVVGVDLSDAVDAAQSNLGSRPDVQVIQADLFRLPFQDASFDVVFSIGVLQHTPSCEAAFAALTRLVKPGGVLAINVYGRNGSVADHLSQLYRRVTTRLPRPVLYGLVHAAVPLGYLHRLPVLGKLSLEILPTSPHPRAQWRVLDTFDWYAPRYQSKHTYPEVFSWFRAAGFTEIDILPPPVSVRGRRPTMA